MTWVGPGFVDNHTHLLALTAGCKEDGYGDSFSAETVRRFHQSVKARGETPVDAILPMTVVDPAAALQTAMESAAETGLVRLVEAGVQDPALLSTLLTMRETGDLPLNVNLLLASGIADPKAMQKIGDDQLEILGVKFYADGWIDSRTAAVGEPFVDTDDTGILFLDSDTLARRAEPFAERGFTIATHAIGDAAVHEVLDAYEKIFGSDCSVAAPRIEHCSLIDDAGVEQMAEMGVVASIQPSFVPSAAAQLATALGHRTNLAFRWADLLEAGVRVVGGTDHPIESGDPRVALRDLVTGAMVDGKTIGAVSLDQALEVMTTDTSHVEFAEDPRLVPVEAWPNLDVLSTQRRAS